MGGRTRIEGLDRKGIYESHNGPHAGKGGFSTRCQEYTHVAKFRRPVTFKDIPLSPSSSYNISYYLYPLPHVDPHAWEYHYHVLLP